MKILEALIGHLIIPAIGALILSHIWAWEQVRRRDLPPAEMEFYRRQYRRRSQSTTMLVVMAVGSSVSVLIQTPTLRTLLDVALFVLIVWIGVLALVDVILVWRHLQQSPGFEGNRQPEGESSDPADWTMQPHPLTPGGSSGGPAHAARGTGRRPA